MAISPGYKQNFDTLCRAFRDECAVLVECQLAATGEPVAVICAANEQADESIEFVPFAMMFQDNPYELLNPPNPEGGFYSQEETE